MRRVVKTAQGVSVRPNGEPRNLAARVWHFERPGSVSRSPLGGGRAWAVAAVAAWGLGWARTWILALVSERIAADLRYFYFHFFGNFRLPIRPIARSHVRTFAHFHIRTLPAAITFSCRHHRQVARIVLSMYSR